MSILETPGTKQPHDGTFAIRAELKEWEKTFAAANNGRKASRDDIKQHPDIAHKYKQYSKLRAALSNPQPSPKSTERNLQPTQQVPLEGRSPKRQKIFQPVNPATIDPYDSPPSVRPIPTHHRTCIGPTPQKDGRVLGLFDLLSPASSSQKTPTKRSSLGTVNLNAFVTPTKHRSSGENQTSTSKQPNGKRPSKSPLSVSKRTHLDTSLTPTTRRVDGSTPRSKQGVSKLRFDDTPNFLRRDSQNAWNKRQAGEGDNPQGDGASSWSPVAMRRRPKPAGRSLSALVKGLRDMEDEKLDEEMDILREIEAGDQHNESSIKILKAPTIVVEDSQVFDMPLGPDGAGVSDDDEDGDEDEGKRRDGKPLKVWKKKGQKRTTRKSNIKPSTAKWKPEPEWTSTENYDGAGGVALVAETQIADLAQRALEDDAESDNIQYLEQQSGSESEDIAAVKLKPKVKDKQSRSKPEPGPKKKKVSATAHANFRALKIKNKQSKAKKGGRFGRGRR